MDEIDAVGRARGGAQGNDERDQTLNQMLSEMDGFSNSSDVIVMGATNRHVLNSRLITRWARECVSKKLDCFLEGMGSPH